MELGGPSILVKPVIVYFVKDADYGKIIYQLVELVYQGRCDARTQWRVQFEDGEEYDLNYDYIILGINMFPKEPPRDFMGNLMRIEIPRDRGEETRPGALIRLRQQSQDQVETNMENGSDEDYKGLKPNEDDDFYQGGDDDAWTEM